LIKREIKEMLNHLGISKRYFKKTMPRVSGVGDKFKRVLPKQGLNQSSGHKPSLRQQYIILRQLVTADGEMRKQMEEQNQHIQEDQAAKSAMQNQAGEEVSKEELKGLVSSVFDRNH
jgi:hypothetical protein